ncbi:MAG: (Fe-S)-binding protein [Proteobacteria bacterium]|nr:(Fe-S)-binding protein [Pseudomonadota bacterium]
MKKTDKQQAAGDQCAKCGACTAVCPVYQVTGRESLTARGRLHLLSRLTNPASAVFGKIVSACLLCGSCLDACPRKIDTLSPLISAREQLPLSARHQFLEKLVARKTLTSPRLLAGLAALRQKLLHYLPETSGLWLKLALLPEDFSPEDTQPLLPAVQQNGVQPAVSYFSGCLARYLSPDISAATDFLSRRVTGSPLLIPGEQACCGLASFAAGSRKEAQDLARKNIAAFAGNALPILTSCASCYSHLRSYPVLLADDPHWRGQAEDFSARVREFSRFFLEAGLAPPVGPETGEPADTAGIFYHDPCHLRFGPEKIIDQPRRLLKNITGSPPLELAGGPHCCGQGGLFHIAHPHLSQQILAGPLAQFLELSASHVVTTCSGCLLQWQQGLGQAGLPDRACHLAVLLARIIRQKGG